MTLLTPPRWSVGETATHEKKPYDLTPEEMEDSGRRASLFWYRRSSPMRSPSGSKRGPDGDNVLDSQSPRRGSAAKPILKPLVHTAWSGRCGFSLFNEQGNDPATGRAGLRWRGSPVRTGGSCGDSAGALETFPGDVFANDREGNVPSEVSASALTLGLPRGAGCQACGDKRREVPGAECAGGRWQTGFAGANPGDASRGQKRGAVRQDRA